MAPEDNLQDTRDDNGAADIVNHRGERINEEENSNTIITNPPTSIAYPTSSCRTKYITQTLTDSMRISRT